MGRSRGTRPRQQQKGGGTGPASQPPTRLTRTERIAARRHEVRRRQLRIRVAVVVAVVIAAGAVTAKVVADRRGTQKLEAALTSGSCRVDGQSDRDSGTGRNHVASPEFSVNPPAGGDHTAQAASAGDFTSSTPPSEGQIVHALEHGYVAVWYRPDIPGGSVDTLRATRDEFDRDVLLVPRESLPVPVAATAWHHRLLCDTPEVESLRRFVGAYRNKGPERVPH